MQSTSHITRKSTDTMSYNAHNTHTVPGATARAPTMGEKIEGTVERTMGHMLPFTDLGHQLKADGARLKGDEAKAEKAESHMDHGVHQSVSTSSYVEGELEVRFMGAIFAPDFCKGV